MAYTSRIDKRKTYYETKYRLCHINEDVQDDRWFDKYSEVQSELAKLSDSESYEIADENIPMLYFEAFDKGLIDRSE